MKMRAILLLLSVFILHTSFGQTISQDVITTTGESVTNSAGYLSWSIGEPVIETDSSSDSYLTQGFQQPGLVIVSSIDNFNNSDGITVYPNPVTTSLYIKHDQEQAIQIDLVDALGRLVLKSTLSGQQNSIDLNSFAAGMYFLRVYDSNNKLISSLKVDKVK